MSALSVFSDGLSKLTTAKKWRDALGLSTPVAIAEGGTGASTALAALANLLPIGIGTDYWGASAPTGWLFCYGQNVSRTTYAALFAAISTTYGVGDGSTTFALPDKRGRASFGKDDMGGVAASRLTNSATGGITGSGLGNTGGEEAHTSTSTETAAHLHGAGALVAKGALGGGGAALNWQRVATAVDTASNNAVTGSTANTGGDGAHNTVPPGIVCNYIIFAGA